MRALRYANEIRSGRARLKRELASGRVRIEDIIAQPPEFARTVKVYGLLRALTDRQRQELIGRFGR
jgi:hypothetical protein